MQVRPAKTGHRTLRGRENIVLRRIGFTASPSPEAQSALASLTAAHGQCPLDRAEVIVALGGDGFMLQTLYDTQALDLPVYGMNCGTIGFLMYVADSIGYLGFVLVMLWHNLRPRSGGAEVSAGFAAFFEWICLATVILSSLCLAFAWRYFAVRCPADTTS